LSFATLKDYSIRLSNTKGEELLIGYDPAKDEYYIDRTKAGKMDFQKNFSGRFTAPRQSAAKNSDLILVVDKSSVELFADGGLTTMTAIYFPTEDFNNLAVKTTGKLAINNISISGLKSIWK